MHVRDITTLSLKKGIEKSSYYFHITYGVLKNDCHILKGELLRPKQAKSSFDEMQEHEQFRS